MRALETGRLLEHDEKSKDHPTVPAPVHSVTWANAGPRLDQRRRRACLGYGGAHVLNSAPHHSLRKPYLGDAEALGMYGWATRLDGFDGNTYPEHDLGSSSLGLAKAAVKMQLISEYRWGFGFDHALEALMHGPCLVGGPWYEPMRKPDARGFVDVSGTHVGGHAWAWVGVNMADEYVLGLNSWGRAWGLRGFFKIPFPGFRRILDEDGDVMLPIREAV